MTNNDLDNESVFNWSHVTASIILLFMCIVLHWFMVYFFYNNTNII